MNPRSQILITAAELAALIQAGDPLSILDVRWRLDEPDGLTAYQQGHLPGAVYVSLEDELSDHTIPHRGRHPLPSGRNLEAAARRWGVQQNTPIVVYDNWNRVGSARAWWVLSAAGLPNVRILDGGLAAWQENGGGIETGSAAATQPGNAVVAHGDLYAGSRLTLTAQQSIASELTLLDARAPERFRGDREPVDPIAGHIPGAKNLPSTAVLTSAGKFLDNDTLLALIPRREVDQPSQLGAYCGSGVSATVLVAALAAAGIETALYPGSWSEWSADPGRPVAQGPA